MNEECQIFLGLIMMTNLELLLNPNYAYFIDMPFSIIVSVNTSKSMPFEALI